MLGVQVEFKEIKEDRHSCLSEKYYGYDIKPIAVVITGACQKPALGCVPVFMLAKQNPKAENLGVLFFMNRI
jgi:hypothetical protein